MQVVALMQCIGRLCVCDINASFLLLVLLHFISKKRLSNVILSNNFKSFKADIVKDFCQKHSVQWNYYFRKVALLGKFL